MKTGLGVWYEMFGDLKLTLELYPLKKWYVRKSVQRVKEAVSLTSLGILRYRYLIT